MPKQSKREKTREAAFKRWWDDKYFSTDGAYGSINSVYEKLHKAGADLDDIDALCQSFLLGELITRQWNLSRSPRKRRYIRTARAEPLHLNEALTLVETFEETRNSLYALLGDVENAFREIARRYRYSPLLPALLELHLNLFKLSFSKVGRKPDWWGSFFLLLMTEYMKAELDREHHREADELLRSWRSRADQLLRPSLEPRVPEAPGKPRRRGEQKRWTAAKRIEQLKQSYPNWPDVVIPILLQLQLCRNGIKEYRASTRRFLERWSSTKSLTKMFLDRLERLGLPLPPTETSLSLQGKTLKK